VASNPVPQNSAGALTADRAGQIVGTVTAVAAEIEQLIAGSAVGGSETMPQIEKLTVLFGNLAGMAIQAAHDVMGKPVTPESVLALMPLATPLSDPAAGVSAGS
jgi:hypothetical protein